MKKMFLISVAVIFILGIFLVRDSFAVLYKYVDKDGVVCFADDLQSVPERYRPTAVIFSGELKDEPKLTSGHQGAQDEQLSSAPAVPDYSLSAAARADEEKPFSRRLAKTIMIITVLVVLYVVLERLKEVIEYKKYDKIVYLARIGLSAFAVIYLVFAHVNDVIHGVAGVGKSVEQVKERSATKGKNAAKAIKTLNALMESADKEPGPSSPASEDKE
ncbi:MAG TPA: hypothetical protein VI956_12520 [Nitrospirota bacterium]|jgi:hypothetical protein|nr:hypothetical protein [Nitrospirota bacterium]